jgi:hypothetical protein
VNRREPRAQRQGVDASVICVYQRVGVHKVPAPDFARPEGEQDILSPPDF